MQYGARGEEEERKRGVVVVGRVTIGSEGEAESVQRMEDWRQKGSHDCVIVIKGSIRRRRSELS